MDKPFIAPTPWNPERPKTLVICCSDGRWHAQVEDFLDVREAKRADMCVLAGGPAAFSLWGAAFDVSHTLEKNFKFLAKHHDLNSVWLIAHQNCAYYGAKYPMQNYNRAANQIVLLEELVKKEDLFKEKVRKFIL